jgi:formiminotetrahydrofolate cyclodeaminase
MVAVLSPHPQTLRIETAGPRPHRRPCANAEVPVLAAVNADTAAFDPLLDAMRLPKSTPEEQSARDAAITEATIAATEVPLGILESCPEVIELNLKIARISLTR